LISNTQTSHAVSSNWKIEPFGDVTEIPYDAEFSASEFEQINVGLIPQAMEDKWFVFYENETLFFHRSWTGQAVFKVKLKASSDGFVVSQALISTAMLKMWDKVYCAAMLEFLIDNLLLGKSISFPIPSDLKGASSHIYQHSISGTAFVERVASKTRPWWKFW